MKFVKIVNDKEKYIDLLLEADPEKTVVQKYLNSGTMYAIIEDERIVCEAVVTIVNDDICELKNIATLKEYRNKGYASKIIKFLFNEYRGKFEKMIVGTTENMIPFYVANGFNKYYYTEKNFFVDNYKEEIWDGDLHCIDMYYYSKELANIGYEIKPINQKNRKEVNEILIEEWEGTNIISRGKIIDGTKLNGFVAIQDRKIVGLITYQIENSECEIVSLNSFIERKGIGTELIEKVKQYAKKKQCKRIFLITTNDNIRAIEFYQKRSFIFSNIYVNAMQKSRKLKPKIPLYADNGLPIRDELEFEIKL